MKFGKKLERLLLAEMGVCLIVLLLSMSGRCSSMAILLSTLFQIFMIIYIIVVLVHPLQAYARILEHLNKTEFEREELRMAPAGVPFVKETYSLLDRYAAYKTIETYDVKTPGADKEIQFLSGGNQQKVIIGRAMACKPKLLVFDEPTKGIDVGTKTEIYRLMKKLAEEEGIGIIMISSEMEEIKKCSNRVIAMYEGKIAGEFDEYTEQQSILGAIIGVNS